MNFEEAANPIIQKFIDEIINKWSSEVKERFGRLEEETTDLINQHKENLISNLRDKMSLMERACQISNEATDQLILALSKLIPAPPPPEQSMIVKAQKTWYELELAASQAEVLTILLNDISMQGYGAALFILKGDKIIGWKSVNLSSEKFNDAVFNQIAMEFTDGSPFYHCYQTYSYISYNPGYFVNDALLLEKLGERKANSISIFPLVVKGKCVAFLYVDSLEEAFDLETNAYIDLLTNLAALAIETLQTRQNIIKQKKSLLPKEIPQNEIRKEIKTEKETYEASLETIAKEATRKEVKQVEVEIQAEEVKAEIQETAVAEVPLISEEEMKLHEDAKRFARLLVSEIKLYNEAQVALGRENKDLYERLKDDIERSKKMYLERVSQKIASTTNYFFEELVRTLAGGDPSALGVDSI